MTVVVQIFRDFLFSTFVLSRSPRTSNMSLSWQNVEHNNKKRRLRLLIKSEVLYPPRGVEYKFCVLSFMYVVRAYYVRVSVFVFVWVYTCIYVCDITYEGVTFTLSLFNLYEFIGHIYNSSEHECWFVNVFMYLGMYCVFLIYTYIFIITCLSLF